jgi:hypothetical protein
MGITTEHIPKFAVRVLDAARIRVEYKQKGCVRRVRHGYA